MSPSTAATPEWQMTTRARKSFIGLIVGAVIVLLAGSVWMTYDEQIRQDPGLRACNSFARRAPLELSEPEYQRLQEMFARSTKASLREHGVRAIEASLTTRGPSMVAVVRPTNAEAAALRAACMSEGALPR